VPSRLSTCRPSSPAHFRTQQASKNNSEKIGKRLPLTACWVAFEDSGRRAKQFWSGGETGRNHLVFIRRFPPCERKDSGPIASPAGPAPGEEGRKYRDREDRVRRRCRRLSSGERSFEYRRRMASTGTQWSGEPDGWRNVTAAASYTRRGQGAPDVLVRFLSGNSARVKWKPLQCHVTDREPGRHFDKGGKTAGRGHAEIAEEIDRLKTRHPCGMQNRARSRSVP